MEWECRKASAQRFRYEAEASGRAREREHFSIQKHSNNQFLLHFVRNIQKYNDRLFCFLSSVYRLPANQIKQKHHTHIKRCRLRSFYSETITITELLSVLAPIFRSAFFFAHFMFTILIRLLALETILQPYSVFFFTCCGSTKESAHTYSKTRMPRVAVELVLLIGGTFLTQFPVVSASHRNRSQIFERKAHR